MVPLSLAETRGVRQRSQAVEHTASTGHQPLSDPLVQPPDCSAMPSLREFHSHLDPQLYIYSSCIYIICRESRLARVATGASRDWRESRLARLDYDYHYYIHYVHTATYVCSTGADIVTYCGHSWCCKPSNLTVTEDPYSAAAKFQSSNFNKHLRMHSIFTIGQKKSQVQKDLTMALTSTGSAHGSTATPVEAPNKKPVAPNIKDYGRPQKAPALVSWQCKHWQNLRTLPSTLIQTSVKCYAKHTINFV